jgi:hypothetical protein
VVDSIHGSYNLDKIVFECLRRKGGVSADVDVIVMRNIEFCSVC